MMPGLVDGDFIFVDKFSYGLRLPVIDTNIVPTGAPRRGRVPVPLTPDGVYSGGYGFTGAQLGLEQFGAEQHVVMFAPSGPPHAASARLLDPIDREPSERHGARIYSGLTPRNTSDPPSPNSQEPRYSRLAAPEAARRAPAGVPYRPRKLSWRRCRGTPPTTMPC
jgi:hypothetical protein